MGYFLYSLLDDIYIDAPDVYSLADEVKKLRRFLNVHAISLRMIEASSKSKFCNLF